VKLIKPTFLKNAYSFPFFTSRPFPTWDKLDLFTYLGPGVAKWLRRCATSRTVPGWIPGSVTGFFSDISPSDRTMVLGSTQAVVKMSTRNIPGGKGGRCVKMTTSPPACVEFYENLGT
jgi:hypothetical protein